MAGLIPRIGIFGGSFDPPHLGHLILAAEAYFQLNLDKVYWVLTPDPPHKQGQKLQPAQIRYQLLQAAIGDDANFCLSNVDMDRPGPHYTLDTVNIIRHNEPNARLFYLIGGDSLHDFPNWYQPISLLQVLNGLGVMRRPGDQVDLDLIEQEVPGIKEKVRFIDAPLLEIASSEIRLRIEQGKPYRYYLPEKVYDLILEKKWYR